jgi:hypothetical protein
MAGQTDPRIHQHLVDLARQHDDWSARLRPAAGRRTSGGSRDELGAAVSGILDFAAGNREKGRALLESAPERRTGASPTITPGWPCARRVKPSTVAIVLCTRTQ